MPSDPRSIEAKLVANMLNSKKIIFLLVNESS